jgi:hypothetical protein
MQAVVVAVEVPKTQAQPAVERADQELVAPVQPGLDLSLLRQLPEPRVLEVVAVVELVQVAQMQPLALTAVPALSYLSTRQLKILIMRSHLMELASLRKLQLTLQNLIFQMLFQWKPGYIQRPPVQETLLEKQLHIFFIAFPVCFLMPWVAQVLGVVLVPD